MDEAALRRLAEIGIDVYRPRIASAGAAVEIAAGVGQALPQDPARPAHAAREIVLIVDAASAHAARLVASIERALAFARVACGRIDAADEARLSTAAALVAFGDAHARAAGRLLSAQRQQAIGWVVTAEIGTLASDARAKRALWSELKRVLRAVRA